MLQSIWKIFQLALRNRKRPKCSPYCEWVWILEKRITNRLLEMSVETLSNKKFSDLYWQGALKVCSTPKLLSVPARLQPSHACTMNAYTSPSQSACRSCNSHWLSRVSPSCLSYKNEQVIFVKSIPIPESAMSKTSDRYRVRADLTIRRNRTFCRSGHGVMSTVTEVDSNIGRAHQLRSRKTKFKVSEKLP